MRFLCDNLRTKTHFEKQNPRVAFKRIRYVLRKYVRTHEQDEMLAKPFLRTRSTPVWLFHREIGSNFPSHLQSASKVSEFDHFLSEKLSVKRVLHLYHQSVPKGAKISNGKNIFEKQQIVVPWVKSFSKVEKKFKNFNIQILLFDFKVLVHTAIRMPTGK